jgi:excisionase family DNA binding protein
LTTPEAAAYLGLSRRSIKYLISRDRIRSKLFGAARRIERASLDEYAAAQDADFVEPIRPEAERPSVLPPRRSDAPVPEEEAVG